MTKQLNSIDHLSDAGQRKLACGHTVDVREIVYIHTVTGTTHICQKCSDSLPQYRELKKL